jgi:acyl carrier protein
VVTAHGDDAERRLIAYSVPADRGEGLPPTAELRAFAGDRLPAFMVPAVFVELAELPLTTNGKVDRAALPDPAGEARMGTAQAYVAPRTGAEDVIAGIWAELLGVERVGVQDNFFDLGGHSLLATQLVSRIREAFDVDLTLAEVFEEPTIEALAAVVAADGGTEDGAEYEEFEL